MEEGYYDDLREAIHDLADELEKGTYALVSPRQVAAQLRKLAGADTREQTKAAEEAAARPGRLSDLLLLVGFKIEPYHVAAWTPENQKAAEEWAVATHLVASDNDVKVTDRPGFLVRYTEQCRNQEAHHCHFCGTYVLAGYESNGNRHWLSDCRPDLAAHEVDPKICTWGYLMLPENADLLAASGENPKTCYAYKSRDYPAEVSPNDPSLWTDKHEHFDEDGPM